MRDYEKENLIEKLHVVVSIICLLGIILIPIIIRAYTEVSKEPILKEIARAGVSKGYVVRIIFAWLFFMGIIQVILALIRTIVAPKRYYRGTSHLSSYYWSGYYGDG